MDSHYHYLNSCLKDCAIHFDKNYIRSSPPSSAPLVLILDRVYLRWCIVSMTTQTTQISRCTRVVHWPPK